MQAVPEERHRSILVVEHDQELREAIRRRLEGDGLLCAVAADGKAALRLLGESTPDLIVLDLTLPHLAGDAILTELRRDRIAGWTPVIALSTRIEEPDQLVGLALGADDYITKPFSMEILVARIRAVLRRAYPVAHDVSVFRTGPLELSLDRRQLTIEGNVISLTPTEFQLLAEIIAAQGRAVRRERLIQTVFGCNDFSDRRIDVHMMNLRRKLDRAGAWIHTIRGVGYACRPPDPQSAESDQPHATMKDEANEPVDSPGGS